MTWAEMQTTLYPSHAREYWEQLFAQRAWGAYPPEELVRFIARNFRMVPDRAQIRVLEIGCGPGPNIWYLVREGYTVAGIDGSPTAVLQAARRLESEGLPSGLPQVDLKVGDFISLPWPDESFDAVVDVAALYANPMKKIKAVVAEVRRVLKPGGLFFSKMFADQTTGSQTGCMIEPGTVLQPTEGPCSGNEIAHFFAREEVQDVFSRFDGLEVDQVHRTDSNGAINIFEWLVRCRKPPAR